MSLTYQIANNDIAISSMTGRPVMIADGAKFKQDLVCDFTTETRFNGFGAGLESLIGTVPTDPTIFTLQAQRQLTSSLTALQSLQKQLTMIPRTDDEQLASLDMVYVVQDTSDPRVYKYFVSVTTVKGQNINATGQVSQ